ncbi:MAG: SpoIIE family protein phosphatase [Verrucomicrobiota bacterium]
MKVLKVNCNDRVSRWLNEKHPELEEQSVESDLPISGCYEQVDLVLVGSRSDKPLQLAKAISDWPSAPPAIFATDPQTNPQFSELLEFSPGIGRNIFACRLQRDDFLQTLESALRICRRREELEIDFRRNAPPINRNMSPGWLFQLLLKDLPEYIYFKDAKGRFMAVSEYLAQRSGLSAADEAIGLTDYDLFDQEHADEAATDEIALVKGEKDRIEKEEFVTWKGNEIWVHSVKLPMVSQSGYPLGTFGISRDITAKKQLSQELAKEHERLADELALARNLQQSLLTKGIPEFKDQNGRDLLKFSAKHIPSTQLSGDFYSVIRTPSGKPAIFLADVMGHGVRAAMITTMLYAAVNEIRNLADTPVAFMQEINNMLHSWLGQKYQLVFATGILALIDIENGQCELCQNGGVHALLSSELDAPSPENPALGLIPDCAFESQIYPLNTGDQIFLFTDGIVEASNTKGEDFGIDGLSRSVSEIQSQPHDQHLDLIIERLRSFTGRDQEEDDLCLISAQLV